MPPRGVSRRIEAEKTLFVYAMTTIGVAFHVWFLERGDAALSHSKENRRAGTGRNTSTPIRSTHGSYRDVSRS